MREQHQDKNKETKGENHIKTDPIFLWHERISNNSKSSESEKLGGFGGV